MVLRYAGFARESSAMKTLQRARSVWTLNSQISQDDTFVHYPFFVLNFPLFTFSYRDFFRCLFVLTYFDSLLRHTHATTHATGTQTVRAKMMRFFVRETSRALALSLAFAAENKKNLPLALSTREKI